jgi:hypothetical protein
MSFVVSRMFWRLDMWFGRRGRKKCQVRLFWSIVISTWLREAGDGEPTLAVDVEVKVGRKLERGEGSLNRAEVRLTGAGWVNV